MTFATGASGVAATGRGSSAAYCRISAAWCCGFMQDSMCCSLHTNSSQKMQGEAHAMHMQTSKTMQLYTVYIYIYVDDTRSRKHSRYHYDKHDDDHNGATAKIAWV